MEGKPKSPDEIRQSACHLAWQAIGCTLAVLAFVAWAYVSGHIDPIKAAKSWVLLASTFALIALIALWLSLKAENLQKKIEQFRSSSQTRLMDTLDTPDVEIASADNTRNVGVHWR